MIKNKTLKLLVLVLTAVCMVLAFSSCSFKQKAKLPEDFLADNPSEDKYFDKSPLGPKVKDKHLNPDVSEVEVMEPTDGEYSTKTIEDFVQALEKFANPNGNKYDALAVLGDFDFDEKGDELLNRFESASESWHATIVEKVGDKCVVEVILKDKTNVELSDDRVSQWKTVYGADCEEYSNVKCTFATNYSNDSVTLSLDLVKINGNWHFASTSSIDRVLKVITDDLLK